MDNTGISTTNITLISAAIVGTLYVSARFSVIILALNRHNSLSVFVIDSRVKQLFRQLRLCVNMFWLVQISLVVKHREAPTVWFLIFVWEYLYERGYKLLSSLSWLYILSSKATLAFAYILLQWLRNTVINDSINIFLIVLCFPSPKHFLENIHQNVSDVLLVAVVLRILFAVRYQDVSTEK